MNLDTFYHIGKVVSIYNYKDSPLVEAVLKILNITFKDSTTLIWKSEVGESFDFQIQPYSYYDKNDMSIPKNLYRTIPLNLDSFDIECIEDVLSLPKYADQLSKVSPLFDSLGWILDTRGERKTIHFVPSPTYMKPGEFWNFDEEDEINWKQIDPESEYLTTLITNGGSSLDWKKGTGFVDGLNMEEINRVNWTENCEDSE